MNRTDTVNGMTESAAGAGCDTVSFDRARNALVIIDQTRLPNERVLLTLTRPEDIREAICALRVRGAPAIGVAAAIGVAIAASEIRTDDYADFRARFAAARDRLGSARPTAVNLSHALERMDAVVTRNAGRPVADIQALLCDEAALIRDEDIRACRAIGEHGLTLLRDGDTILTHCNAGRLAAVRYGTALAPLYVGLERGLRFRVFADETRPVLQGARLTAFELVESGIDTTLICDNMAARVMASGDVNAVLIGSDRVARNGDACNKIGSSGVAVLAKHYGIPLYVCAPLSTVDMRTATGADIPIETRAPEEITELWYARRMAPAGVKVFNPAFDVVDHALITAIVTERGVARPPFSETLPPLFEAGRD